MKRKLQAIYPLSSTLLPVGFTFACLEKLPTYLRANPELYDSTPYLADLAAIELAVHKVSKTPVAEPEIVSAITIDPGLDLLEVSWQGLADLLEGHPVTPVPGNSFILILQGTAISDNTSVPKI